MNRNMIDYLRSYGQYTFAEKEFNSVDSLILSQFAYLKFDGLVPDAQENKAAVSMLDILVHPDRNSLFRDERYEKVNRSLFEAMVFSKRFQNMKINHHAIRTDVETETQFCAVTFYPENGPAFVAYRGTDETLVGWKEDLNMTFLCPVPGQRYAVEYLDAIGKHLEEPFVVGGHSKGGNLAVYASLKCEKEVQKKILTIYNNDGPGFRKEVFEDGEYEKLSERIVKTVPQFSFFGMLLQDEKECIVIKSSGVGGIGQHDPYTWEIENGAFIELEGLNKSQKKINDSLNNWVANLSEEELKTFATTLFDVIGATEADTVTELTEEWKENRTKMVNAVKDVDSETKKQILDIISILFLRSRFPRLGLRHHEMEEAEAEAQRKMSADKRGKSLKGEEQEGLELTETLKEMAEAVHFSELKEAAKKSKAFLTIRNSKAVKKGMSVVKAKKSKEEKERSINGKTTT